MFIGGAPPPPPPHALSAAQATTAATTFQRTGASGAHIGGTEPFACPSELHVGKTPEVSGINVILHHYPQ